MTTRFTLQNLSAEPTALNWRSYLNRLIYGDLEGDIINLGSIEEVVEVALRRTRAVGAGRDGFETALGAIITSWTPEVLPTDFVQVRMIELIAAFRPPEGFPKLVVLFNTALIGFSQRLTSEDSDDLLFVSKSLNALGVYHEAAPLQVGSASYADYLHILNELVSTAVGPHALRRLIELGATSNVDGNLKLLLTHYPEVAIREVLRSVLASRSRNRATTLRQLFRAVVLGGQFEQFVRLAAELGCTFVNADQNPELHTATQTLTILIDDQRVEDFYYPLVRWNQDRRVTQHA